MSDLISRADAIKAIEELPNAYNGWSDTYDKACIIGVLESLPSADRPTGKWKEMLINKNLLKCSNCQIAFNKRIVYDDMDGTLIFKFCPNCGAKMEGMADV